MIESQPLDDPFAESEPALAELWKVALLGRPIDDSVALQKKAQLRGLPRPHGRNCGQMDGFSLHANTFVGPAARDELYKLVKYLCRPSIAGKRVTEQHDGRFRVELKTAWRDGTTAVFLSPANLTARMAALIPLPPIWRCATLWSWPIASRRPWMCPQRWPATRGRASATWTTTNGRRGR